MPLLSFCSLVRYATPGVLMPRHAPCRCVVLSPVSLDEWPEVLLDPDDDPRCVLRRFSISLDGNASLQKVGHPTHVLAACEATKIDAMMTPVQLQQILSIQRNWAERIRLAVAKGADRGLLMPPADEPHHGKPGTVGLFMFTCPRARWDVVHCMGEHSPSQIKVETSCKPLLRTQLLELKLARAASKDGAIDSVVQLQSLQMQGTNEGVLYQCLSSEALGAPALEHDEDLEGHLVKVRMRTRGCHMDLGVEINRLEAAFHPEIARALHEHVLPFIAPLEPEPQPDQMPVEPTVNESLGAQTPARPHASANKKWATGERSSNGFFMGGVGDDSAKDKLLCVTVSLRLLTYGLCSQNELLYRLSVRDTLVKVMQGETEAEATGSIGVLQAEDLRRGSVVLDIAAEQQDKSPLLWILNRTVEGQQVEVEVLVSRVSRQCAHGTPVLDLCQAREIYRLRCVLMSFCVYYPGATAPDFDPGAEGLH
jgi:hypothetical protein